MKSAAPKFKGTMLMMNQTGAPPPAGPKPPPAAGAGAPPSQLPSNVPPGAPSAGAVPAHPSRLKGTIVGVAAPAAGAAPAPPPRFDPSFGVPPPVDAPDQHQFGARQGANPLGATVAFSEQHASAFGPSPYGTPGGALHDEPPPMGGPGAGYGGPPQYAQPAMGGAYGAPQDPAAMGGGYGGALPTQDQGAMGSGGMGGGGMGGAGLGSGYGAPHQDHGQGAMGGYGQPQPSQDPFGGPPPAGGMEMGGGMPNYGAPPPNPYGAPTAPHGGPEDYGIAGGGYNQMPPMGGMGGPMQPYGAAGPMGGPGMGMMAPGAGGPPKSWMTTLLLALFLGYFGAHRFYTGHTLFGVLQLLTCGGGGIWTCVDVVFILMGKYTDAQGRPLQK